MWQRPKTWPDWYGFARATLGYDRDEAVVYANLRYTEELNRGARKKLAGAAPRAQYPKA